MLNVAIFVSGGGTNLQAIIDAKAAGKILNGNLALVVGSRDGLYALERAKNAGIPTTVINRKQFASQDDFDDALIQTLQEHDIGLVVLAGYLSILSERFTKAYSRKIINVHPSLIPSFCGAGFYGLRVHQSALDYGVKVTGATVHFVNEIPDGGEIIAQKAVEILPDDTAETLQKRVMEQVEWKILPQAVSDFCDGKLK